MGMGLDMTANRMNEQARPPWTASAVQADGPALWEG